MKKLRHTVPQSAYLFWAWLVFFVAFHAKGFFPNPLTICIREGDEVVVRQEGPGGATRARFSITEIINPNPGVASSPDSNALPIRAQTAPKLNIKGESAGTVALTVNGTYNGQPVSAVITVKVLPKTTSWHQVYGGTQAGDPVSTVTGEYFGSEGIDLNLGGPLPLFFSRYYASRLESDSQVQAALGRNRSHNFASRVEQSAFERYHVILPTGKVLAFQKKGRRWVQDSPVGLLYQFTQTTTGFLLGDPVSHQIWTYDTSGRLTEIADAKGNELTLSYNVSDELTMVADGLGRTLTLAYTSGKITSVTDHTGRQVTFGYTGENLTSATDTLSKTTTYAYDGNDLLESFTRPEGNTPFTQVYTSDQVTSQTERGTDVSMLNYAPNITTFTDPTSETIVDTYNTEGQLISHADEAGNEITMGYDSNGRRCLLIDREGDITQILYHAPTGLPFVFTNAEGKRTVFLYRARRVSGLTFYDLSRIIAADGGSRSFVYDAKGNLVRFTDEVRKTWRFTYNDNGQVLTSTNPLRGVSTFTYDAAGNLASSQDPDTGVTTYDYDPQNRLETVNRPDASTVDIDYDARNRITMITDERSNAYSYTYDDNGRLTDVIDPKTESTSFAYDTLDRIEQITDRLGAMSGVTFDSRHLIDDFTDRNNNTTDFQYDDRRRPEMIVDAGGKTWSRTFDREGLVITSKPPGKPLSFIKRNQLGQPIEFSDGLTNTTILRRDALQRITDRFDPVGRSTRFTYDKKGQLTSVTEQASGTARYSYDPMGNLVRILDPNRRPWQFTHTRAGRLASRIDPLGNTWSYTYDNRGRPSQVAYPDGETLNFTFDVASNLTDLQFSGGPALTRTYDALNRLETANGLVFSYDLESRITNILQNAVNFGSTWDPGGRLDTVTYLNGAITVDYVYDTRNRLTQVSDTVSGAQIDFTYDDAGNLTGMTRSNGVNATFTVDLANRLSRIQDGGFLDLLYGLNPAGDIVTVDYTAPVVPAPSASTETFQFGRASEITSSGFAYDPRGRLIESPGHTYQWDGADRLVGMDGTTTLTYNGLNDVVTRTVNAAITQYSNHYAIGLAPIVHEFPVSGPGPERVYVWTPDGRLLYSIDLATNKPIFYHFDRVGSTLALTDETGTVTDAYAYGPYGVMLEHTGSSTQPFTYIGAFGVRQEGHLHQMRSRYYDAQTARFISRDLLPPRLRELASINPYEYAAQNPTRYIDPEGTWEFDLAGTSCDYRRGSNVPAVCTGGICGGGPGPASVGHFYTIVGYEVVPAPDNFFYSRAYSRFNSEPFTHTGVLGAGGSGANSPDRYSGWTTGWDTGFDSPPYSHHSGGPPIFASPSTPNKLWGDYFGDSPVLKTKGSGHSDSAVFIRNVIPSTPPPPSFHGFGNSLFFRSHLPAEFLDPTNSADLDGYLLISPNNDIDGAYLPRNYDNDVPNQNADLPIRRS